VGDPGWAPGDLRRFGLGKTLIQLEIIRLILLILGRGRGLIVCPLGVRQEFIRDARLLGIEIRFIRSHTEATGNGIYITNYESVRDGKLDPRGFDVVSLDEAAILRGFGGTKTFRQLMALYEGSAAYRFVATATPSPNDFIELLSYAAFLDIMDVGQGKTRFFKRDSAHADRLTLHPHMEQEWWHWVASWALFLSKPSDLDYSDEGYELPPLDVRWHEIPAAAGAETGGTHRDGQGYMFADASLGVQEAAAVKRESLAARVAKAAELVTAAKTGLAVAEHQRLTVANFLELTGLWADLSHADSPFMPVLQAAPGDADGYLECARLYEDAGVHLADFPVVGVGTVCRIQDTVLIGRVARALQPLDLALHWFGVKLSGLRGIWPPGEAADSLTSFDSMAWSYDARRAAPLPGCKGHKNCANCPAAARRWRGRVMASAAALERRGWQGELFTTAGDCEWTAR
jgi:hypothetical protein